LTEKGMQKEKKKNEKECCCFSSQKEKVWEHTEKLALMFSGDETR